MIINDYTNASSRDTNSFLMKKKSLTKSIKFPNIIANIYENLQYAEKDETRLKIALFFTLHIVQ